MPSISFTTASGESVSFTTKRKRKKTSNQLTAYQRHVRQAFKNARKTMKGEFTLKKSQQVMKMAAKSWEEKKQKKSPKKKKKKSPKKKKKSTKRRK